MSPIPSEPAAQEVLRLYGLRPCEYSAHFLGNHGGFSGAGLWRVQQAGRQFCLRAWPSNERSPGHLLEIHRLMRWARAADLTFVPEVWFTPDFLSSVEHADRLWDLTEWLSGRADFHEHPTARRLEAALTALAHLHAVWFGAR